MKRKKLLLCLLVPAAFLAFPLHGVAAETTLPDTPVGKYVSGLLNALNSGDEDQWRDFLLSDPKAADSSGVFERRLEAFGFIFGDLGGLEVDRIESSSEYDITVLAKGLNVSGPFAWVKFTMQLDTLPPHGWAGLAIQPADNPYEVMPEGEVTAELLKEYLDEVIDSLLAQDRFSGAVLVAKDGVPLYQRAAGEACKRYHILNKIDTKFNLGSMNKMFTSVAIAQLVQQGKLAFTDLVGKHLPDYPNEQVRDEVTIRQLLTHTSGLGDYWEELFDSHWWEIKTVQQYADLFADKPLEFEPGDHFQYSNAGPIVLGLIIEKISGMSYYDYIRSNVTNPAAMYNTDCYEVDAPVPNLAIGYTKANYDGKPGDTWRNNLFMHAIKGGPAGGGYSTVADLLSFDKALRNNLLVSREYFGIITTGKEEMGPDFKYGYLFGDRLVNGQRIIGHNGGAPGINAVLDMYLDSGFTVAVMTNYDNAAMIISDKLERLLTK